MQVKKKPTENHFEPGEIKGAVRWKLWTLLSHWAQLALVKGGSGMLARLQSSKVQLWEGKAGPDFRKLVASLSYDLLPDKQSHSEGVLW